MGKVRRFYSAVHNVNVSFKITGGYFPLSGDCVFQHKPESILRTSAAHTFCSRRDWSGCSPSSTSDARRLSLGGEASMVATAIIGTGRPSCFKLQRKREVCSKQSLNLWAMPPAGRRMDGETEKQNRLHYVEPLLFPCPFLGRSLIELVLKLQLTGQYRQELASQTCVKMHQCQFIQFTLLIHVPCMRQATTPLQPHRPCSGKKRKDSLVQDRFSLFSVTVSPT
jgi:hypothetical protein